MALDAIMKAALLIRERVVFPDGAIVEMVAWRIPSAVWPSLHEFKYRLGYIVAGVRVLGHDNERGKGDYRHQGEREQPFQFVSVNARVDRFVEEVEDLRREP